jgi:hypothetical protein
MAGQYGFVSPGAMARNAIEEELLNRAALQRQAMLDKLTAEQQQGQADRAQQQLMVEAERERRIAEQDRQTQANLEDEREFRRASTIAESALPEDPIDEFTAELLKRQGFGSQIRRGQPTQGDYLGDGEAGVPQYNVIPGILQMRGGSKYLNARAAEDARAAVTESNRVAADERASAERANRELIARIMADSRRDSANAPGRQSDYERFLNRWATAQGLDPAKVTADQELAAREQFYKASRSRSPFDDLFDDDASGGAARPAVPGIIATTPQRAGGPGGRPASGGSAERTATVSEVRTVAQRAGISEAEARKRLEAAGVVVR